MRKYKNALRCKVLGTSGEQHGLEATLAFIDAEQDNTGIYACVVPGSALTLHLARALVGRTVAEVERELLLETVKRCFGNRTHAANILGISIRTLRNKLNEYASEGLSITPPGRSSIRDLETNSSVSKRTEKNSCSRDAVLPPKERLLRSQI